VDEASYTQRFLRDDLGADSLDTVELVMAFEEASISKSPTKTPRRFAPSTTPSTTSASTPRRASNLPEAAGDGLARLALIMNHVRARTEGHAFRACLSGAEGPRKFREIGGALAPRSRSSLLPPVDEIKEFGD